MNGRTILRNLSLAFAGLFFLATLFRLADQLNLIYQPPNVPASANLVDRVTALIPYRHSVWPLFLGANGLLGIGFLVLAGMGIVLAARAARADERRSLLLWTFATAGLLGAVAQFVLLGAVKAAIDIPYCDCGFKTEEIVSQVWAEMVVGSAVELLIYAASIMAAAGLVVVARMFSGRGMPTAWGGLSYATAALLAITVGLGYADIGGDITTWLTAALVGIVIPGWALWLGLRFEDLGPGVDETS